MPRTVIACGIPGLGREVHRKTGLAPTERGSQDRTTVAVSRVVFLRVLIGEHGGGREGHKSRAFDAGPGLFLPSLVVFVFFGSWRPTATAVNRLCLQERWLAGSVSNKGPLETACCCARFLFLCAGWLLRSCKGLTSFWWYFHVGL